MERRRDNAVPPKKKWGQNFLRNPSAVRRIVDALEPESGELILEIGPGEGVLTEELVKLGHPVRAIEIDPDLARRLQKRFGGALELIHGDATEIEMPNTPLRAVGNLPYNVANPIIRRVIAHPFCRRAVFMVQKEVADRIVARPGDDAYGFFALLVQLYADTRVLLTLEPGSFYPRPKVRSAVVVFDPVARAISSDRDRLIELISASFRMRRKKLVNNLIGFRGMDRASATALLHEAGIDRDARADTLSLEDFDRLVRAAGALWTAAL